ncbi:hypothetical protein MMC25_000227, partial [Agyrium rufum]|nr:hypothetical protein [Agyrium rufum]
MASATNLPRIRKHESDANNSTTADSSRYSSSRDHYKSRDERRDGGGRDREAYRDTRRRSRSPGHRSSRPSRREEVDSYSSSRDYRAREREDRYTGGRDSRDDRAWDRDRGGRGDYGDRGMQRRDARRDDDRRAPPRERDAFDARPPRRDDRGGRDQAVQARSDRDEFAAQMGGRKKSASPPPKKREPTPDLTDTIPITERKRRLTQWDIKPPGYENVTAEQAKLSGMFPLPGAPRQQPMDPSKLQAFMNQPGGSASNAALKPSNARQSKRLFVHNLPPTATEETMVNFFNLQMNGLNTVEGIDPCISCHFSTDRTFMMVEFKTPSDATLALAFDGMMTDEHETSNGANGSANGGAKGLSIRRPKDYIMSSVTEDVDMPDGVISTTVPDSQNKISVTNIPVKLTEEQVNELLSTFGQLKSFVLVKDQSTDESRGIAFCEFADSSTTDLVVEGLNNMELGDQNLKVTRASIGVTQAAGLELGVNAMSLLAQTTSVDMDEGRVLQLLNMVTPEELMDNEDFEEICEDVREECEKYGGVLDLKIPRPSGGSRQSAGVGKIFVKFDTPAAASKALAALAGRKFADRTVVTTYFSE